MSEAETGPPLARWAEDARLTPGRKVVYGLGDFTVNTVLTSLSMIYIGLALEEAH